jgi:hypothetical protein
VDHPNPPFQRVTWPDWLAFSGPYSSATLTPCRPISTRTPKQRCPVPQSEAAALSQGLDEGQYRRNTNTDTRRSSSTHAETAAIDSDAPWPWDGLAPSRMCMLQAMPCARHRASHPQVVQGHMVHRPRPRSRPSGPSLLVRRCVHLVH